MSPIEPPSHASYLSRKYFSALDGFRFLAIVSVIWHHTQEGFWWFPASRSGFLGVDFFFVISGFLIVTLLLRERDRTGGISLRRFYLRRSLRIFPIFYGLLGALVVFFVFIKPHSKMAGPFFATLPSQVAYLSNFVGDTQTILGFSWSLSTEEQFYLVWPPLEKWLRGLAIPVLMVAIAVSQLVNFGLLGSRVEQLHRDLALFQITITPICLGVLLAHILNSPVGFARASAWLGRPRASLILMVATALACNDPWPGLDGWPRLTIQVLMTLLLAASVIREDTWLNRALDIPAIRRVGVISYGMYIFHEFAAHVARALVGDQDTAPPLANFAITLTLTILVAELSYRFFETPFLRLKDRLGHKAADRADARERAEERSAVT